MFDIRKIATASVAGLMLTLGVVACEPQHPNDVPGSAQLLASGDKQVAYTTQQPGMVYVYDQQTNHLIWSGQVSQGKQIKVDQAKNQITVDGQVVSTGTLAPYHTEQIWFNPTSNMGLVAPSQSSSSSTYSNSPSTQPSGF